MIRIIITIALLILAVQWATSAEPARKAAEGKQERDLVGVVLDFSQQSSCALSERSATRNQRAQVMFTLRGLQIAKYSYGACQVPGSGVLKAAQNAEPVRPIKLVTPVYTVNGVEEGC